MMEHLPPVGWADVATKRDLDHMAEVFDLRLTAEAAGLKGEMAQLRTELQGEFAAGMNVLEQRLTDRFETLRTEQRQFMLILVAGIVSTLGAVIGLS